MEGDVAAALRKRTVESVVQTHAMYAPVVSLQPVGVRACAWREVRLPRDARVGFERGVLDGAPREENKPHAGEGIRLHPLLRAGCGGLVVAPLGRHAAEYVGE